MPEQPAGENRREVITDEAEAMHWLECRSCLHERWNTSPEEIGLWIREGAIRLYVQRIRDRPVGHYWEWTPRLLERLSEAAAARSADEFLGEWHFRRAAIEDFQPGAARVKREAHGKGSAADASTNPSGRFLSYCQAVGFLAGYAADGIQEAIEALDAATGTRAQPRP